MKKAAVIGSPVSHSLSPSIFGFVAARLGLRDFRYLKKEVSPQNLPSILEGLKQDASLVGANVTLPLKSLIVAYLDEVSPEAKMIGAVNAVKAEGGRLSGYNTDVLGIRGTLQDENFEVEGQACLIWGAGGAAKAVTYVLGLLGASRVFIFNPRSTSAESLARQGQEHLPKTTFIALSELQSLSKGSRIGLVVNSTPVGMKGVDSASDGRSAEMYFSMLTTLPLAKGALAFDLIYNPEETPFLQTAKKAGMRTIAGLTMLIDQALASLDLWAPELGIEALSFDVRQQLRSELAEYLRKLLRNRNQGRPIFLAGFMGAGKSSVGLRLAHLMGREFIDLDQLLEEDTGMSVPEIFRIHGEAHFRGLEKKLLIQAANRPNSVVSLGGGALMDPESLQKLQSSGQLVYLEASPASLEKRLQPEAESRPLLAGLSAEERLRKIQELLEQRRAHYESAPYRFMTDDQSPAELAQRIASRLEKEAE